MKKQGGYTPLTWIIIVSIVLLIVGVSIAMLFGNTDIGNQIKDTIQNTKINSNENNKDQNTNIENNNMIEI